jgi:hypothetical protein
MFVHASPATIKIPRRELEHKYINVDMTVDVTDVSGKKPKIELLSITENETNTWDGRRPDIIGAQFGKDDRKFKLRAELNSDYSPRVYTITYKATNATGHSTIASTTVTVSTGN